MNKRSGSHYSCPISTADFDALPDATRRFIQTVARGVADDVRLRFETIDPIALSPLQDSGTWAALFDSLNQEVAWRMRHPQQAVRSLVSGEPLPEQIKGLRRRTSAYLRHCTSEARRMLERAYSMKATWPGPQQGSLQYVAAVKIASVLASMPGVTAVFLFGSTGRGTNRPDSDLDMIVTLDRGWKPIEVFGWTCSRLGAEACAESGTMLVPSNTLDGGCGVRVQLVITHRRPERMKWYDLGFDAREIICLWRLESAGQFVEARRGNPKCLLSTSDGQLGTAVYDEALKSPSELQRFSIELHDGRDLLKLDASILADDPDVAFEPAGERVDGAILEHVLSILEPLRYRK